MADKTHKVGAFAAVLAEGRARREAERELLFLPAAVEAAARVLLGEEWERRPSPGEQVALDSGAGHSRYPDAKQRADDRAAQCRWVSGWLERRGLVQVVRGVQRVAPGALAEALEYERRCAAALEPAPSAGASDAAPALDAAEPRQRSKKKRGRPPELRDHIMGKMRADLDAGLVTLKELEEMKQDSLASQYAGDVRHRTVAQDALRDLHAALDAALDAERRELPGK